MSDRCGSSQCSGKPYQDKNNIEELKKEEIRTTLMCCTLHFNDTCARCGKDFKICGCRGRPIAKNEGENGWCSIHGQFYEPICPYCVRGY